MPSSTANAPVKSLTLVGAAMTMTKTIHTSPYPSISPLHPALSQRARTVLVTGGSAGIPLSIARSFALAGAATVIITGRRADVVAKAAAALEAEVPGVKILARTGDSADPTDVAELWDGLAREGVVVDVLVLGAGLNVGAGSVVDLGLDKVWGEMVVNVRHPLANAERFCKQPGRQTGQKLYLVNLSTAAVHAFRDAAPWPSYALTKNAGTLAIQQIALSIAADDVQVVSFHPGLVLTDFMRRQGLDEHSAVEYSHPDLGGNFAVWAASEQASFLHGRFVWASWDVNELMADEFRSKVAQDADFLTIGVHGLV